MGVMTLNSRVEPQDCMSWTTCWCEYHLTSMPAISTMKSPSLIPPNWKGKNMVYKANGSEIHPLTSASELISTCAMITGASPRTWKPKFSNSSLYRLYPPLCSSSSLSNEHLLLVAGTLWYEEDPFCKRTHLGAVQWRRAENIAMGPRRLKGSLTLCDVKSGPVRDNVNFEKADYMDDKYEWIMKFYILETHIYWINHFLYICLTFSC